MSRIIYRSFENNIPHKAKGYQMLAFSLAKSRAESEFHYKNAEYDFYLRRCPKFTDTFFVVRDDQSLSGILTTDERLEVRSTADSIKSAVKGCVTADSSNYEISDRDYCVEYANSVVEIKKGEKIWLDELNRIIIGWHGTYSPPHGM